jgi:hypothetical protein
MMQQETFSTLKVEQIVLLLQRQVAEKTTIVINVIQQLVYGRAITESC